MDDHVSFSDYISVDRWGFLCRRAEHQTPKHFLSFFFVHSSFTFWKGREGQGEKKKNDLHQDLNQVTGRLLGGEKACNTRNRLTKAMRGWGLANLLLLLLLFVFVRPLCCWGISYTDGRTDGGSGTGGRASLLSQTPNSPTPTPKSA